MAPEKGDFRVQPGSPALGSASFLLLWRGLREAHGATAVPRRKIDYNKRLPHPQGRVAYATALPLGVVSGGLLNEMM